MKPQLPDLLPALTLAVLGALLLLYGCVRSMQPQQSNAKQPAPLPPVTLETPVRIDAFRLSPGLACMFIDKFYRNVNQLPRTFQEATAKGRAGTPISLLDVKYAKDALIFGSGEKTGLGLVLEGYLQLSRPGTWRFRALSNDGIEFSLGGKPLFIDPTVHKDRLTPTGTAHVKTAGYYPLLLRYFQRKGTATLKLYWQPPGSDEFTIIPSTAYHHLR